ncbi:hypothetical protein SAMN05216525_16612 [Bradyrhizobium sp. Gha]|nr:hypothetical protein SAMN05216525_16612 [Bradyrhizobium sp. Gha]
MLVPSLRPGDTVIVDNLGSLNGKSVRRAIGAAGAKLFFLPPYSPDLTDRASLRQAEDPAPKGSQANCRGNLDAHWHLAGLLHAPGTRQLLCQRWIRFNIRGSVDICLLYVPPPLWWRIAPREPTETNRLPGRHVTDPCIVRPIRNDCHQGIAQYLSFCEGSNASRRRVLAGDTPRPLGPCFSD